MEIKIESKYYEYLSSFLKTERPDLFNQLETNGGADNLYNVNEEWMLLVRDWAGERLQKVGFDENYKLTHQGEYLEYLIDLLYN